MTPTILVSTWSNGLYVATEKGLINELPYKPVRSLTPDGRGGALAIVDGHSLYRRTSNGEWVAVANSQMDLACCLAVGADIYVGTEDAQVLRLEATGQLEPLAGFEATPGREKWYAGTAVINGQTLGPPLGIRSMSATCDSAVLFANVHVGGIARSTDKGATWQPTVDIESDVHQVCAHPTRPDIVIAAAAVGLLTSRDAGATWRGHREGLHAAYCSAVNFADDNLLVAASTDHFAAQGSIYIRHLDDDGPLRPLEGGLPTRIDGIADTDCIGAHGNAIAVVDRGGTLYESRDCAQSWTCRERGLPIPSGLLIVRS